MSGERYRSPQSIHYATAQATDSFSSDSESPMDMVRCFRFFLSFDFLVHPPVLLTYIVHILFYVD
jgi:hypothetical protein